MHIFVCSCKVTKPCLDKLKSYSKDALFLGELSCAECPEVDVGLSTGDDIGAVAGVKLHSKHSFSSTLQIQHIENNAKVNVNNALAKYYIFGITDHILQQLYDTTQHLSRLYPAQRQPPGDHLPI